MPGTRNGPREILVASSHLELWDEETNTDVHPIGIYTLPEMELPFDDMGDMMAEIRRVTAAILEHDKFPIVLGGEHSITGAGRRGDGRQASGSVGAADRRPCRSARHATWARDSITPARCAVCSNTRAARRWASAACRPKKRMVGTGAADDASSTTSTCARNKNWIDQVVESLGENVYITIDVDGLDPAIMPATGTPEPGGLSWYETAVAAARRHLGTHVVGCDLVELSPLPGVAAPNFLCAKLIYKILTYQFTK